jgi:hypothetical protein
VPNFIPRRGFRFSGGPRSHLLGVWVSVSRLPLDRWGEEVQMTLVIVALVWVALSIPAGLLAGHMLKAVQPARVITVRGSAGVCRSERRVPARGVS